jgi:surface-anchored protein
MRGGDAGSPQVGGTSSDGGAENSSGEGGSPAAAGGASRGGAEGGSSAEGSGEGGGSSGEGGEGGEGGDPPRGECEFVYDEGHGDIFIGFSTEQGLQLTIRAALEPGKAETLYAPSRVCVVVPVASRELASSYGGVPANEDFAFIGLPPGESFWLLPAVATRGIPWFGASTEGVPRGHYADDVVALRINALELPAGASVATWFSDAFGSPAPIFSTADSVLSTEFAVGAHLHFSWSFTHAGVYRLAFEVAGQGAAGGIADRQSEVLSFLVEP